MERTPGGSIVQERTPGGGILRPERKARDDKQPKPRVLVSIPDSLIAKVHEALQSAGAEGLSCTQLLNHPKCKRLKFPCTLRGASPGAILRSLNCVRYENKRYYFDATARPAAFASVSTGVIRYTRDELVALKAGLVTDVEFQENVVEKLRLLGLRGDSDVVPDWAERILRRSRSCSSLSPSCSSVSPLISPLLGPASLSPSLPSRNVVRTASESSCSERPCSSCSVNTSGTA